MDLQEELKGLSRKGFSLLATPTTIKCNCRVPDPYTPGKTTPRKVNLHLAPTLENATEAYERMKRLRQELQDGSYNPENWTGFALNRGAKGQAHRLSFKDLAAKLEARYDRQYPDLPKNHKTIWGKKYRAAIELLASMGGDASEDRLCDAIQRIRALSTRKSTASLYSTLLKEERIKWDIEAIRIAGKGYVRSALRERDIPDESLIQHYMEKMNAPHWRLMYGLCWLCGIRPHEIVGAQIEKQNDRHVVLVPDNTKTGYRECWPFPYGEFKRLKLHQKANQVWPTQAKDSVATAFAQYMSRNGVPFSAYNLRHAYALRHLQHGTPIERSAKLMGHTVKEHEATYQRWLTKSRMKAMHAQVAAQYD